MEINTPHFNAIAEQFLTESKKARPGKQNKKDIDKPGGKKNSSKKAVLKKLHSKGK